jgi:hypothetical protein
MESEETSNSYSSEDGANWSETSIGPTKKSTNYCNAIIASSFLWYPLACLFTTILLTLATSYLVPEELLTKLLITFLIISYLIPVGTFLWLIMVNRWFRRNVLWILLLWFGISQVGPMTQGAMIKAILAASQAVRAQITKQSTSY